MKHKERKRLTPRCSRTCVQFSSVAGVLLLSVATFGCGPDFPNTLLNRGVGAVLRAPEARFLSEIARMGLVAPVHQAKPTKDAPRQSLEAELSDLNMAL